MIKKIILVGHDNFGAREIISEIVKNHPHIDFCIIITTGLYYKKSFFASIIKMLREASFVFCLNRFWDGLIYKFKGDTLYSRSKKWKIEVYFTEDINGSKAHEYIKDFSPDLIVSTFTMHIYKEATIKLARVATIGCHPSILPDYRGLEVFFWQLVNKETSSGVSIFYMAEKIDAGNVIMQEKFDITPDESVDSLYRKLTRITARLMVTTIEKFKLGDKFEIFPSSGKGSYYPMPTRDAYRQFIAKKGKWR
ncbi:MAG: formyltransferase family protein [Candidatus Margulisiibacteriota bacterium]